VKPRRPVTATECPTCHEEPGVVGEPCLSRGDGRDPWHDTAERRLAGCANYTKGDCRTNGCTTPCDHCRTPPYLTDEANG
jgi:hypothetical protein